MIRLKFELNIFISRGDNEEERAGKKTLNLGRKRKKKAVGINYYGTQLVEKLDSCLSYSTKQNYLTSLRSFYSYLGDKDISLSSIDSDTIMGFQRWLLQKGICLNTVSCYIRPLRAIYNRAVEEDIIIDSHPFKKSFTGMAKTTKRSISEDDIRRIQHLELDEHTSVSFSRDLFLFSFYTQGMPFVDIAFLRKSQLHDGSITYQRHKTGQKVVVKLRQCMTEIINRYIDDNREFVFPLISSDFSTSAERQYLLALGQYNRDLKKIAMYAGIDCNLTSYCARHTWASVAYNQNVDLPVISKALGHTDTQTTMIYIRELNDNRLAEANKKILDSLGIV